MVRGLIKFREFFQDQPNHYILIGGTACDFWISEIGLNFRATKDFDIIIISENMNSEFGKKFWEFIKSGEYENKEIGSENKNYFRFKNPLNKDYPVQLELFTREYLIKLDKDQIITPIPINEEISSLSAIVMDNDYYNFVKNNCEVKDGINYAKQETLICLKATAYLDLVRKRKSGKNIDRYEIVKHKNDIIRLSLTLNESMEINPPSKIKNDLESVIKILENEPTDFKNISKNIGMEIKPEKLISQIKSVFKII